jgi:uncharacterized protein
VLLSALTYRDDRVATVTAAPVERADRIRDIDVIRGFALFGVAWMNLFETTRALMPAATAATLPLGTLDRAVAFLGDWLIVGKAQCLFGVLFGVGFALFTERVLRRGADAGRVYARRLLFLFIIGLLHLFFLWFGDILHDYALVGFLLLLIRRLPTNALLTAGAVLLLFSNGAVSVLAAQIAVPDASGEHHAVIASLHAALWHALSQGDYVEMVRAGVQRARLTYGGIHILALWGQIAGQFLIGAWIYRKGWLQEPARHAALMRRAAMVLVPAGLLLSLLRPLAGAAGPLLPAAIGALVAGAEVVATPLLAFGYAAAFIVACRWWPRSVALSGLAAFGRMALTNYVGQSVFYFLVFDGFGIGLIGRSGAAMDLLLAVAIVFVQIAISVFWLRGFRFGPLEWVWRSATYGEWQRLRATAGA